MSNFVPIIPDGVETHTAGFLYASDDVADLGQDMIEIEDVRSGLLISAGWVPEGDPNGAYEIAVTKEFQSLQADFRTSNFDEACDELQAQVHLWLTGGPKFTADSDSSQIDFTAAGQTSFRFTELV